MRYRVDLSSAFGRVREAAVRCLEIMFNAGLRINPMHVRIEGEQPNEMGTNDRMDDVMMWDGRERGKPKVLVSTCNMIMDVTVNSKHGDAV